MDGRWCQHARWTTVMGMALANVTGCGGDSFRSVDEAGGAGLGGVIPEGSGSSGTGGAPGSEVAGSDPGGGKPAGERACLPQRIQDSPSFDREICYSGGEFEMGSNLPNLSGNYADHTPTHSVTVGPFALDAYEVTVARFRACVDADACGQPGVVATSGCSYTEAAGQQEDLPVTCVNWSDAQAFCAWDGARRLPTEAEWEYAARGAEARTYPWGASFDCENAVLGATTACPDYASKLPRAVGSRPPGRTPEGAHDLAGNVLEWVSDWVGSYARAPAVNPSGPSSGSLRVLRGGDWSSIAPAGRSFIRVASAPSVRGPWGFRCARTP